MSRYIVQIRRALSFDGVDDYVEIADSPSLRWDTNPFTISFWAKENITREQDIMRHKETPNTGYWRIQLYSTTTILFVTRSSNTNELFQISTTYRPTGWFHAVLVRSDPVWTWYLNGAFNKQQTDTRTGRSMDFRGIQIGRTLYAPYFAGAIDEVRIYNRALSQDEIAWLYNNGRGRPTQVGIVDGCVLCLSASRWRGSSWVKDISGYNNHGVIYGAQRVRREF